MAVTTIAGPWLILERLEQSQPRAEDFVVQHALAGVALPRWQLGDAVAGEQGQVVAERIDVFAMRQHHHQSAGAGTHQRRGD